MAATAGGEIQFSLTQTQLIWRDLRRHRAALAGGIVIALLVRGDAYRLWNLISWDVHLFGVVGEQRLHLFGTDDQGRDLPSRVIFATRLSMNIGVGWRDHELLLAVTLGGLSGYYGGAVDLAASA